MGCCYAYLPVRPMALVSLPRDRRPAFGPTAYSARMVAATVAPRMDLVRARVRCGRQWAWLAYWRPAETKPRQRGGKAKR